MSRPRAIAVPEPTTSTRIAALDGIRGLAIALVLICHLVILTESFPYLGNTLTAIVFRLLGATWSGVDLFFVLSGYLIGGILLDHHDSPHYYSAFYSRRFWRIVPMYLCLLIAFLAASVFLKPVLPPAVSAFLLDNPLPSYYYLLFVQNVGIANLPMHNPVWLTATWSLAVEEQFYLTIPFLMRVLPRKHLAKSLAVLALGLTLLRAASVLTVGPQFFHYMYSVFRVDTLLVGVLCACAVRHQTVKAWLRERLYLLWSAAAALFIVIVLVTLIDPDQFSLLMILLGYPLFAGFYALVLLIAVLGKGGPVRWLVSQKWLQHLGILAYGIYLFHLAINGLLHGLILGALPSLATWQGAAVTALALVVILAFAEIAYRMVEKPLLDMGRRVSY